MDYTGYAETADALTTRIAALGPQILTIDSPWDLFKVPGFKCDDIGPTLAQADWALSKAKQIVAGRAPKEP